MSADGALTTDESEGSAAETEDPTSALEKRAAIVLKAAPQSAFFTIIPLLERLLSDRVRVGGEGPTAREGIRFRHDVELGFSSGDITRVVVKALPRPPERSLEPPIPIFEVTTTFLGLTGIVSPLPLYLSEEILHEDEQNPVRRDFLDLFHHRVLSLLYRCVSKFSPAREHLSHRPDAWMKRALYLTGLDPDIQTRGMRVHPSVLVRLAPLLAGRGRGPRMLELALREALGEALLPDGKIRIKQFAGGWIEVDEAQRMALGVSNNALGAEAILGKSAYDQSGRMSVQIGPLHPHNYRRFLRDGDLLPLVKDVVELCSKEALDWDVELLLAPDAAPSFTLSSKSGASELGRDTRLRGASKHAEVVTIRGVGEIDFDPSA